MSEALGDQVLVSFGQCDGELHAAVIGDGKARLQVIGGIPAVSSEVAYLRAAVRRMLSGINRRDVIDGVRTAADFADRMILAPLRLPADQPVILVPSGPLYGMPWALLPPFHDRVLVVAPSVTSWRSLNAAPTWDGPTGVTIVVGPDIECGSAEAQLIVERHGGAQVLRADMASVAAVKDAFASAGLVHLAAHGAFRADSPLLSSFRMADGPLTVFDIEHLARVPEVIILSSCEAASVSAFPGDDLMGVAATLVGRGVRSLIAPVDTVADAALVEPTAELHRRLKAGAPTAEALAGARASFAPDSIEHLTLATFQCIGANVVIPGVRRTTSG